MSNDLVNGSDGNDVIDAGGGNDTVIAGAGDDVIYQKDAGSDVVDGGDGTDRLVLDYSAEDTLSTWRGIWRYFYDADGHYLARSGVDAEVAAPADTAQWGFHSTHYGVTYTGIEQFDGKRPAPPPVKRLRSGATSWFLRGGRDGQDRGTGSVLATACGRVAGEWRHSEGVL